MDGAGESESLGSARRLLTRLAAEGARLRKTKGSYLLEGGLSMPVSRVGSEVSQELVLLCIKRDWLERDAKDLVLSAAGRAWLRRLEMAGDPFREQHQLRDMQLREIEGVRRAVLVNEAESPLGWLKSRKGRDGNPLITDSQYQAGERLRADYWFAQLSQRVTANWSALAPTDRSRRSAHSDAASLRDDVIAAKERVRSALEEVGPELSGVLIDICCELKGLEEAEKSQGWPQRAGKVVLQIALSRLARHYGLGAGEGSERRRRSSIRHWGSEDYRPTLDAWRGSDTQ
jgi:hypothetical protein